MTEDSIRIEVDAAHPEKRYWKDVWQYRDLFYILIWRDIKVRYKQTIIGALWAIIQPLFTMLAFTFVFGKVAGLAEQTNSPYPLLVFIGVQAWQLISQTLGSGANAILLNENIITKVYFPRLLLPLSSLGVCLLDFFVSFVLLLLLLLGYGYFPGWSMLFLPLWLFLLLIPVLGATFWLAALNVKFRDFRYALPFCLQVGLFISPVGFTGIIVPDQWQWLYQINPAVGIIESFRSITLGFDVYPLNIQAIISTVVVGGCLLWGGYRYFRATERSFADNI